LSRLKRNEISVALGHSRFIDVTSDNDIERVPSDIAEAARKTHDLKQRLFHCVLSDSTAMI